MNAARATCFLLLAIACGSAEIVAPAPLSIVDTSPSQGAEVPADELPVVLVFSEPVERASLVGVTLEETTRTGQRVRDRSIALEAFDLDSNTATFTVEPLPADTAFLLTIDASIVEAVSGAQLPTDVVRRFRTAP